MNLNDLLKTGINISANVVNNPKAFWRTAKKTQKQLHEAGKLKQKKILTKKEAEKFNKNPFIKFLQNKAKYKKQYLDVDKGGGMSIQDVLRQRGATEKDINFYNKMMTLPDRFAAYQNTPIPRREKDIPGRAWDWIKNESQKTKWEMKSPQPWNPISNINTSAVNAGLAGLQSTLGTVKTIGEGAQEIKSAVEPDLNNIHKTWQQRAADIGEGAIKAGSSAVFSIPNIGFAAAGELPVGKQLIHGVIDPVVGEIHQGVGGVVDFAAQALPDKYKPLANRIVKPLALLATDLFLFKKAGETVGRGTYVGKEIMRDYKFDKIKTKADLKEALIKNLEKSGELDALELFKKNPKFADDLITKTAEYLNVEGKKGEDLIVKEGKTKTKSVDEILKERKERYKKMTKGEKFKSRFKRALGKMRTGFYDVGALVEDVLKEKIKEGKMTKYDRNKFEVAFNRKLRSSTIAGQMLEEMGYKDMVQKIKDIDEASEVLSARHRLDIAREEGLSDKEYKNLFGNKKADDTTLVDELWDKYKENAAEFQTKLDTLMEFANEHDLIKKGDITKMKKKYENYVPLYDTTGKVFDFDVIKSKKGSIAQQTAYKDLRIGGDNPTKNVYEAFIDKAYTVVNQSLKNDLGKVFADYGKSGAFGKDIRLLKKGETSPYTIKYLKEGKTKRLAVPKEIYEFAEDVGVAQTKAVLNLARSFLRAFKIGTTGANPAFALSNVVKDFQTARMNSEYGLKIQDSVVGLGSSLKSWVAQTKLGKKLGLKRGKLEETYSELGGSGNVLDIFDNKSGAKLDELLKVSQMKGVGKKIKYTVIRAGDKAGWQMLKDLINQGEQMTRLGVFRRNVKGFMKEGYSRVEAERLALIEALDATANFARGGRFRSVLTALYPYQSAGFAGARTFQKSLMEHPGRTAFRIARDLVAPEAALMAWNLSDDKRKKIYQDIQPWVKDMNFVIITPGAKWDEKNNRWSGVWLIPKPPGLYSITAPMRRKFEEAALGEEPQQLVDYLNTLADPALGIQLSEGDTGTLRSQAFASGLNTLVPHLIKPPLETGMGKRFWEAKDLIPDWLKDKPAPEQAYRWTPDIYKELGRRLNVSPLEIERMVKGYGGSATEQAIGAKNPLDQIVKRFYGASGGRLKELQKKRNEAAGIEPTKPWEVGLSGKVINHKERKKSLSGKTIQKHYFRQKL